MSCPSPRQIMSQHDCDAAFSTVISKYGYDSVLERSESLLVSWPHHPKGCSVSKGKAYYNTDSSPLSPGDAAVGASLSFQVVCAPAAYKEFALARFCGGAVLYNGGGPKAEGKFQSYASCEDECDHDPRCKFFLWKHEQGTSWVNHCATFSDCSTSEAYTDGKGAMVFRKLASAAATDFAPPEQSAHDLVKSDIIGFHGLRKQEFEDSVDAMPHGPFAQKAPLPAAQKEVNAAAHAAVAWFACQLKGGHERIVWTAKHMVIMTKMVRKKHCARRDKLLCTITKFYTGKWAIEGAEVVLKWDVLPPMRLSTGDGGHNFQQSVGKKVREYQCSVPPFALNKLIKAGIEEAAVKLAKDKRTKAGRPTSYTDHGCVEFAVQPAHVMVNPRGMTLSSCFLHCVKTKGIYYFAVTRGDACFCSQGSPGSPASWENCDLTCSGNHQENCGGFGPYAQVYTMIDCLPPDAQEIKEDLAARDARMFALYDEKKGRNCGQHKGNDVQIEGSTIHTGRPKECIQLCLTGKGSGKCHGFTYDDRKLRCTFHMDAFWGNSTKDPFHSCYFKKPVPLLG